MDADMGYDRVKKVISVNIVYFDLGEGHDYIYHGYTQFKGVNKGDVLKLNGQQQTLYLTDAISEIYPEYYIIKVDQFDDIATTPIQEWIYFLKNEEIKDEFAAQGLVQAKAELDIMKLTETERKEYERYIDMWRYEESLTVSNYKAGKAEQQIETARKCLAKGMSVEDTCDISGLSLQQVRELLV